MIPALSTWRRWANPRLLLIGIAFGIVGLLTLWADMRLPIFKSANVAADVREIFVVLGAGLTGPWGGLLAGAVSSLYSPINDPTMHFATWLGHTLGGFALGLVFRSVPPPEKAPRFLLLWLDSVLSYYLVLVSVFTLIAVWLFPALIWRVAGPAGSFAFGIFRFATAPAPEMIFVIAFTYVIWMALPLSMRKPL